MQEAARPAVPKQARGRCCQIVPPPHSRVRSKCAVQHDHPPRPRPRPRGPTVASDQGSPSGARGAGGERHDSHMRFVFNQWLTNGWPLVVHWTIARGHRGAAGAARPMNGSPNRIGRPSVRLDVLHSGVVASVVELLPVGVTLGRHRVGRVGRRLVPAVSHAARAGVSRGRRLGMLLTSTMWCCSHCSCDT